MAKNFTSLRTGSARQAKLSASQILKNIQRKAQEEEWEEELKKEVKELLDEKPKKQGAKSDFGRGQRDVATEADKTVYDRDFGKPKTDASKILDNVGNRATEEEWEEGIRKEVKEFLDEKPRKSLGGSKQAGQGTTKIARAKIRPKTAGVKLKAGSFLKNVGKIVSIGAIAGVIGFAIIDHIGVAVFENAADKVLEKIGGETDLSDYLPSVANKVVWSEAFYLRFDRDMGENPLPNVVAEEITFYPPKNGIMAFGIALGNLPDFVPDINVNGLGNGNSDWLCEKFQGYFICRSMSESYPLVSDKETVVTLYFHLPGYEIREMLAQGSGSRDVYFIVK